MAQLKYRTDARPPTVAWSEPVRGEAKTTKGKRTMTPRSPYTHADLDAMRAIVGRLPAEMERRDRSWLAFYVVLLGVAALVLGALCI